VYTLTDGIIEKGEIVNDLAPWYPYPFLNPEQLWEYLFKDRECNIAAAWAMVIGVIILFIIMFYLFGRMFVVYTIKMQKKWNYTKLSV
jgi:hypothetical protein